MFLAIDPQNGVAIYEQIVRQVNFAVAGEALVSGDLVPSVRELARQLAVNPNTVAPGVSPAAVRRRFADSPGYRFGGVRRCGQAVPCGKNQTAPRADSTSAR